MLGRHADAADRLRDSCPDADANAGLNANRDADANGDANAGLNANGNAAACIAVLANFDLNAVLTAIGQANFIWLLPIIGLIIGGVWLRAWRWQILLPRDQNGRLPAMMPLISATFVCFLANSLLPAKIGEPLKGWLVSRRFGLSFSVVLGTLMLERAVDVIALVIVAAAAMLWMNVDAGAGMIMAAALIGVAVLVALFTVDCSLVVERLRRAFERHVRLMPLHRFATRIELFLDGFRVIGRRRIVLVTLLISIGTWMSDGLIFWLLGQSLDLGLSPAGAMLVATVAILSTALPGMPGSLGTYELAAVAALAAVGVGGPPALAFALVGHLITFVPSMIIGLVIVGANNLSLRLPDDHMDSHIAAPPSATARSPRRDPSG